MSAPVAAELEALSQALVAVARDAISQTYPACGLWAADMRSELNRVWRDFHTA
ncbi:MAG: acyl-CoA dehydrogenase, partial [Roseateles sp.]